MNVSPVNFQSSYGNKQISTAKSATSPLFNNSIQDMEFDMVADKIKSENIKNQMNVNISHLKRNLSNFINKNNA